MSEPQLELLQIADKLREALIDLDAENAESILTTIGETASAIGRAWSGSYLGYQANVYYETLNAPPVGNRFNAEWGLMHTRFVRGTSGGWKEFTLEEIQAEVTRRSGNHKIENIREHSSARTHSVDSLYGLKMLCLGHGTHGLSLGFGW